MFKHSFHGWQSIELINVIGVCFEFVVDLVFPRIGRHVGHRSWPGPAGCVGSGHGIEISLQAFVGLAEIFSDRHAVVSGIRVFNFTWRCFDEVPCL